MTILQAIILGIIQGLTEFLPVSSSGHLVVGQYLLGLRKPELLFDVGVHFATLIAVAIYFRQEIVKMITGLLLPDRPEEKRAVIAVLVGTIPAGLVGYLGADFLESLFANPRLVGFTLIANGILLLTTLLSPKGDKTIWTCGWLPALIVGCTQAVAILPGISRSGSTITAGLLLGLMKEEAGRFSFILSLPAILGATILEGRKIAVIPTSEILPLFLGILTAMTVGYLAIGAMMKIIRRGKLYYFAPYCILVGILLLIML